MATKKAAKKTAKKATRKTTKKVKKTAPAKGSPTQARAKFPRQSASSALRIPKAILEQNAGRACTPSEAAAFLGLGNAKGNFEVEISSSLKYGFLERPQAGQIQPTSLAKKILRPQAPSDVVDGFREAVFNAPDLSEVYQHYRGENLPDDQFLLNTVVETYKVPAESFPEFKQVFIDSLETAELITRHGDKVRILDSTVEDPQAPVQSERLRKLGKSTSISATDTCFVMQPFASPLGDYYDKVYRPAIEKAGLRAMRADADIFGTGKIMDQVWSGINSARVLVAELTTRNPNVFYELGLAHALKKPVVLVSAKEDDVPFDLQHIRVIYYDTSDPFWGAKLIEKVAENVLSALNNPEEAVFQGSPQRT